MKPRRHRILAGLNRARRRAGLDRNPMRRREDHIQSAAAMLLILIFLAAAPPTAAAIGAQVYASGLRTEQAQAAERRQILATVVNPNTAGTAQVTWHQADGTSHTTAYQDSRVSAGGTTRVWVDRSDRITQEPRTHDQTITDTTMTATGAVAALAICLAIAYGAIKRRLDRSRYLLWDNGWEWANVHWGLPGHRPDQQ
jgi:hypothetical protein